MGKLSAANIKKTLYFLKRNGLGETIGTVLDRMHKTPFADYSYVAPSSEEIENQKAWYEAHSRQGIPTFSVLVPLYRTNPVYLRRMLDSVREQTYRGWELILVDGTENDSVEKKVREYLKEYPEYTSRRNKEENAVRTGDEPPQIYYIHRTGKHGISANTNAALQKACGYYVALLDHDDELTQDALFEIAQEILKKNKWPDLIYSDEDKMSPDSDRYYDPHFKLDYDLDYLLCNNYICHLTVARTTLAKSLGFREAFDGAQDHDFLLRLCMKEDVMVAHVGKVLYHWRCFQDSTSENPASKAYAYVAGQKAVEDALGQLAFNATVEETTHVGFFQLRYRRGIFSARREIGVVGGKVLTRGIIVGGAMSAEGEIEFAGLRKNASGYMNRALVSRKVPAVDIRCMLVRSELQPLFAKVVGVPYVETAVARGYERSFDVSALPENADYVALSLAFCDAARKAGYDILYSPQKENKWKK